MRRRRGLSYRQQQTLSLLGLAVLPLVLVGVVVLSQVAAAVNAEADNRVVSAGGAVQSILSSDAASLAALAQSYAQWSVLADEVAALQQQDIAQTVVDFQVAQGGVDAAVVVAGTAAVAGGPTSEASALERILRDALDASGTTLPLSTYADLPGGVYQVDLQPIDLSGRSGPGVVASGGRGGLAFARRLGSDFVVQAKQLTGFDVSIYNSSGALTAASDQSIARLSAAAGAHADVTGGEVQRLPDNVVAVAIPVQGSASRTGTVVVATQLNLTNAIGASLVPYLAVLLTLVLLFATSLAVYLAELLRRRLGTIEAGIGAVAGGNLGVRLPEGDRDVIDRLAASHNRLAAVLERRDRVVWGSLEALEDLRPERGPANMLGDVLEAARSIFGLDTCWMVDGTGSLVAIAPLTAPAARDPTPPGPADPDRVSADLDAMPGHRLEGSGPAVRTWTLADRALFGLFAREVGVALRSAGLQERTARRAERLSQANELQRQFVRGLGHNLQAPLARILMSSEDLAADGLVDPSRERAEAINADADRLTRVVRELLTATRLDAGVFIPKAEPFALAPAARRAWHALATDRRLDLADRSVGWLAIGDRDAVEQVLWILLDNAVRYAPSGPVHVTIEPTDGSTLAVRVRDEGPGIPQSERGLVFRRFQRGSTARGHDGTGLGLDVARRLLRTMGGRIRYEDGEGGGATFAFTIPAEHAEAAE
jgi:signal transduction histidine kinase